MKNKKSLLLISIVGLFLAFFFILVPGTLAKAATSTSTPPTSSVVGSSSQAPATNASSSLDPVTQVTPREILSVVGLNGTDAKVTDMNGKPIEPTDNLYTWDNFNVNYDWSIPDGVQINAGDTAPFELPEGLVSNGDLSFPIYNASGVEIGTASIKNGEKAGTITFNNVLSSTDADRKGTLHFISKGTNTGNGNEGQNWMFNKIGWVGSYTPSGVPDELTWNIAFNPNEHNLNNVVITDVLGDNQEYIPGSLTAIGGSYGPNGFANNGQALNPTVTVDGKNLIISFPGNVTTAVDIYYRVKLTGVNADGSNTWSNHATMGSSEGEYTANANTSWGGSGTGDGNQRVGTLTLKKIDEITGVGLSGAEYELTDSKGEIIMSNAVTDASGKLSIKNLPYGTYTLKEVKAPDGYQLNSTPLTVTIPDNDVIDVNAEQKDAPEVGGVLLKKINPDTNAVIAGTTFNLLDKTGKVIQSGLVTDLNGEIAVENLPTGQYSFVETAPAAGYEANSTPINFVVVAGQVTPVELKKFNVPINIIPDTGNVVLTKSDSKVNKLLPGAVYTLLDSNGKIVESGLVTDANGQISIPDLEAGNYSFVEVTAPEGYELNKTPIEFTVVKDSTNNVAATDDPIPTNPGGIEPPVVTPPTEPEEPGVTEPPVVIPPTGPEEPGEDDENGEGPTPPVVTPPTNPGEPGVTVPPVTPPTSPEEPGKPGVTVPPVVTPPTGPEEPGKPGVTVPPVVTPPTGPEEPGKPGVTVPPVTPPTGSEKPGVTTPTQPEKPNEVIPPINSNNGNNSGSSSGSTVSKDNGSNTEEGKFPQTGNEAGIFLTVLDLLLALFVILRHFFKRTNY